MKNEATGSHGARAGAARVSRGAHRLRSLKPRAGFSLAELLIAMVIFLTVAGGIALLFSQSIRTVKVGHQNIDISEHIRAAMDLVETDLTQAFTSRDYGDYYTFYGTPIGMTFVGLVRPNRDASQPNLSRVTYVIYGADATSFVSHESYAENLPNNTLTTYQLLRYVEPDQDNLESLPIRPQTVNGVLTTLPWPNIDEPVTGENPMAGIYQVLRDTAYNATNSTSNRRQLCESEACVEEVIKGAKRELWMRMLSGDVAPRGGSNLPPFWREDYAQGDPDALLAPSYRDYVIAENIVLIQKPALDVPPQRENIVVRSPAGIWPGRASFALGEQETLAFNPIISYGALSGNQPVYYHFWNDQRNMIGTLLDQEAWGMGPFAEGNSLHAFGSPMAPRMPMMVNLELYFLMKTPYAGAPDLFRGFVKQIDVPTGYTRGDLTG